MSGHQDWEPVVMKKFRPNTIKEAKKRGLVKTVKKVGNLNTLYKQDINSKKLEEEDVAPKKIAFSVSKLIQQARFANKITQSDLAKTLNLHPSIIKNYESGKVIPNKILLSKMGRILKMHLTGKNIGKEMK